MEVFNVSRPIKRMAKPINTSAKDFNLLLDEKRRGKPIAMMGSEKLDIFILKPIIDINQAVIVVPIFAPIITPIASISDSKPAFTKLTTITVVAEEDCMIPVIRNPVNTPFRRFEVIALRIFLNFDPATF
jgi:hypothetical protein